MRLQNTNSVDPPNNTAYKGPTMTFEPKSDAVAEIRIRKYPNRRLYSTADKRFVTLNEIAEWVRQGKRVAVTDSESQTDITSEILTQILLEGGRASHVPV